MSQLSLPHENLKSGIPHSVGVALVALFVFALPAFLDRPMNENPEARVAVVAREMIQSGNYVVPTLGGEPRLMKPPLPYWTTVAGLKVTGASTEPTPHELTLGLLLPLALIKALGVLVTALYGCAVFGRTGGVMAGAMLATCFMLNQGSHLGFPDGILMSASTITACATAWLVTHPNPGVLAAGAMGLGLGLGILIKEPFPFMVFTGGLVAELLLRRTFDSRKLLLWGMGLALAALIAVPWYFVVKQQEPNAWQIMAQDRAEIWDKNGAPDEGHVQDDAYVYYFYKFAGGLLPWTVFLVPALILGWGRLKEEKQWGANALSARGFANANARYFLLVLVFGFLAFYLNRKQQDHYLWSLLPVAALLGGYLSSKLEQPGGICEEWLAWLILIGGLIEGIAAATFPAWSEWIPAPKKAGTFSAAELASGGWVVWVSTGLGVLAISSMLSRWVVNGRMLLVGLAGMLVASLGWSVVNAVNIFNDQRHQDIYKDWEALRKELVPLKSSEVYAANKPPSVWMFYLGRTVNALGDLPRADVPNPKAQNKTALPVVVGKLNELKALDVKKLGWAVPEPLPEPSTERTYLVVTLKPVDKTP